MWIRRIYTVGMYVKQDKGGGVKAYPEIEADFHPLDKLNPAERLALIKFVKGMGATER